VAAIHHSLSPLKTLLDAGRVLKAGGSLLVVEAPSPVVAIRKRRRQAIELSRTTGATEVCHTRGEIHYILRHAGFDRVSCHPVDSLTRGAVRKALRGCVRRLGLEDALRPPVYVIVARGDAVQDGGVQRSRGPA
jgi:hypothetical protein